jgi:hypothetical protein
MGEDDSPEFGDDDDVDPAPGKPNMTTRAGLPDPDGDEAEDDSTCRRAARRPRRACAPRNRITRAMTASAAIATP